MTAFHALVGAFDYPMVVLTTTDGTERAGCLVGFATQCSIDPPRFLACVSDKNRTHAVVAGAATVAVHVLRADQRDLAALFGGETGDEVDKFARCAWSQGPDGVPVLDECRGWFGGRIVARLVLGDHTGLVLAPFGGAVHADAAALSFQQVKDVDPGHDP